MENGVISSNDAYATEGNRAGKRRAKKRVQSGVVRKNVTLDSKFLKTKAQESEKRLGFLPGRRHLKPSQLMVSDFANTSHDSELETNRMHLMKSKLNHNDHAASSNFSHLESATMASQDPVHSSKNIFSSNPTTNELTKPH